MEAFIEWGLHEWRGRLQRPPIAPADSVLTGINTAIWFRAPLVVRILIAEPHEYCVKVEIPFEMAPQLHIANGQRLEAWTDGVLEDQGDSGKYVRELVAKDTPVEGPIVCTAIGTDRGPGAPVVIFDGWHRAAAWVAHGRRGVPYPISAYLILTRTVPPLLGPLQP